MGKRFYSRDEVLHGPSGIQKGQAGLVVLIATPIARAAFSFAAFLRDRDWMYGLFTLVVLAAPTYSLAGR